MVQSAETSLMKGWCSSWKISIIAVMSSSLVENFIINIFILLLFSHQGYQNCFKRDDKFYKNFKVLWQLRKIEWPPDVQFFPFYKL